MRRESLPSMGNGDRCGEIGLSRSLGTVWRIVLCCAVTLLGTHTSLAATTVAGLSDTPVVSGLSQPTAMAFAPDGRLFITEQGGTLRVVKNNVLLDTPFVTLTVGSGGERGLVGLAFDPDFATNQFVYVFYTATTPVVHSRVSRFTANGDVAVPDSEVAILDLEPLDGNIHNGGAIHFGPDRKLYVAVGDNWVPSNAQSLDNRLGKILRINPDGSIPADNPFYTLASGDNRAIWAFGLRNPYNFAIEPLSGALFINDVGENTYEEVNEGVPGANYGWPYAEGPTTEPAFRGPVVAYTHNEGCAITGGTFHSLVQRSQFPLKYWGAYFFADFCAGWVAARTADGASLPIAWDIVRPVDLQMGPDGSLYYLARGASATEGHVGRIDYVTTSPGVSFTANGQDGPLLLTAGSSLQIDFGFDAGASGFVPAAELYIAVVTPFGMVWLDAVQGFGSAIAPAYVGPLPTFGPAPLLHVADVSSLASGVWAWVILVDPVVDGFPTGEYADYVLTAIE
jgi:glucose/arabinose dehydrogenase